MQSILLFLVVISQSFFETNADCSDWNAVQLTTYANTECPSPQTLTTTQLANFPSGGTKQLTVSFNFRPPTAAGCSLNIGGYSFALTIQSGGVETTISQIKVDGSDFLIGSIIDTTGTVKTGGGVSFYGTEGVRVAFSIDLQNNVVSWANSLGLRTTPTSGYNFGSLIFDSTTKMYFGSDKGGVSPSPLIFSDLVVNYKYTDNLIPVVYDFTSSPTLIASYSMKEGSGNSLTDSTGTFGTAYFGNSGPTTTDQTNSPIWNNKEVTFTTLTQFISLPVGRKMCKQGEDKSFCTVTFSFWVRIDDLTGTSLLKAKQPSGNYAYELELLNGVVKAKSKGTEGASAGPLTVGAWTLMTATFIIDPVRFAASLYVGDIANTPRLVALAGDLDDTNLVEFKIGGFIGAVSDLKIYSHGSNLVYNPSCLSSCSISLGGLYSSQCLVSTCGSGTSRSGPYCVTKYGSNKINGTLFAMISAAILILLSL